jgi:hypothetical protein
MKGIYAVIFGNRRTGRLSLVLLAALGGLSLIAYWML